MNADLDFDHLNLEDYGDSNERNAMSVADSSTDSDKDNESITSEGFKNLLDNPFLTDNLPAKLDLRLYSFQEMGRISELFPGAYFDFSKRGWMCRKCLSLAKPSSNPWISSGVRLGRLPTQRLNKHFKSELHKKSLEAEYQLKKFLSLS